MNKEPLLSRGKREQVLARLEPRGWKSVQGWSSSYDDAYPQSLEGIVSPKEFRLCIDAINQTLEDYFPCPPSYICGYLCCLGTLGASLLCLDPCSKEMENHLSIVLNRINSRDMFVQKGIIWQIHCPDSKWSSWIQITRLGFQ